MSDLGILGSIGEPGEFASDGVASEPTTEPRRPVGGVVDRTGIALVHEGEMIVPAVGSEAELSLAELDQRNDIRINLPVIVEIDRTTPNIDEVVDLTLRRLRLAVEAQPNAR